MATYVVLVNWTDQGIAGFKGTAERVDHEAEIRKRAGVDLKEIGHGNSRTTTLRAFDRDEFERIVAKLG